MRVDAGTLGLLFSAISTLVVVVGALAAVRQLRHLQRGNELAALGKLVEEWNSERFVKDREFVRRRLAGALEDADFVAELRSGGQMAQPVSRVANFFERLAIFVQGGALSEEAAMLLWGQSAESYWRLLRESTTLARAAQSAGALQHFEDFAMRAPEWRRRDERRVKRLGRDPALAAVPGLPAAEQ